VAVDGTVQQTLDGVHLPPPTDQIRLGAPERPILAHAQQAAGGHGFIDTFDPDRFRLTQNRGASTSRAVDALSITRPGGATDSIRWAIPHLLTDGGVTKSARTDLASDNLAGIQADPQLQCDTVAVFDLGSQVTCFLLDVQRRHASADGMVLQGRERAEHRHDPQHDNGS
jgi:hypothetical protein